MSDEPEFIHTEADLSKQLGLSREDVRAARAEQLDHGTDWQHVRGAVRYTAGAWAKLKRWLKISASSPPAAVPPAPAAAPGPFPCPPFPPPVQVSDIPYYFAPNDAQKKTDSARPRAAPKLPALVPGLRHDLVCQRHYPNKRIVGALFGAQLVRVRVKDSAKITKGMVMPCEWIAADLWEMKHKLPRRKGKW